MAAMASATETENSDEHCTDAASFEPGYTVEELRKLETLAASGYFLDRAAQWHKQNKPSDELKSKTKYRKRKDLSTPLLHYSPFSEKRRLKEIRARLENRAESGKASVNLLTRFHSTESPREHIRDAESKALSYWYRRGQEDYVENWLLKFTPIRHYYERFRFVEKEPTLENGSMRSMNGLLSAVG